MKTVQQIMQETGAKANIRNFRYMQENYTYKQKVRHAENVARSYQDKCSEMGLNCHVSVGGLDSITLHYFLETCGVHVPCVSCSSLEQKGVQAVHKQIAAEMENTYSAREWLGAHMALPQDEIDTITDPDTRAQEQALHDACPPVPRIGGADFSSTTDLTAAVVIFMVPGDPHIYVLCMFWLPEELLERRVREDRIPYDLWKEQGYLRTCEGNKVRQKDVTEWFLEVQNELDCYIYCGGYDAWSASYWVDEMQDTFGKGVFVPVQQTMKTLSLPMKQLGADFDSKLIIYNNNPVLKWCLANTGIVEDKNGNIKPNKTSKARKRIDGLAALLDAFVVFQDRQDDYKTMI